MKNKRLLITIFGGWFGLQYYLDHNFFKGIIYTLTCGICCFGWFYDIFREVKNKNTSLLVNENEVEFVDKTVIKENGSDSDTLKELYYESKSFAFSNNYIVVDVETTGLDFLKDRIFEISAIKYQNGVEVATFNEMINPQQSIPPVVIRKTGVSNEEVKDKPIIDEILPQFLNFIGNNTLVAHNALFDFKMIASECNRVKLPIIKNKVIDTLTLARKFYSKTEVENYKLETFKKYFNLDVQSHRALDDCITCNSLYRDILNRMNSRYNLNDEEIIFLKEVYKILHQANREIEPFRAYLLSNNVLDLKCYYRFMSIKIRGKLHYITFGNDVTLDSYDFSKFEISKASKSDKANFRIVLNEDFNLEDLKEIIIKEYDKQLEQSKYINYKTKEDMLLEGYIVL